jgi:hypothetical protein
VAGRKPVTNGTNLEFVLVGELVGRLWRIEVSNYYGTIIRMIKFGIHISAICASEFRLAT